MAEMNKTNSLLAECEAFLTELSADEESTLTGGTGYGYKKGDDDDSGCYDKGDDDKKKKKGYGYSCYYPKPSYGCGDD